MIDNLKRRETWSQNSLHAQGNIVIEDYFEESTVKMISPFEYEISAISFLKTSKTFSVLGVN